MRVPTVEEPVGLPVLFDGDFTDADRRHLHYGEVGLQQRPAGHQRHLRLDHGGHRRRRDHRGGAATRRTAWPIASLIPNVRYRRDIGDRLIAGDFQRVEALGLLAG